MLALVGVIALGHLMWPPLIGIANNGDFERLMHWGQLQYITQDYGEKYFAWINREFRITGNPWLGYGFPSSEAVFIKLSAILGAWLLPGDRFDLRILGLLHVLGFVAALWLLLRGWQAYTQSSPFWLLPGLLLLFCDTSYTVYFHSFYSEPAALIFLLAMTGAGLWLAGQPQKTLPGLLLFCLCAGLFIAAKPQNFVLIPLLLAFCARLYRLKPDPIWRSLLVVFAVLLVASSALLLRRLAGYVEATRYHCVFYGILKDSPTPEQDLRELGLDEKFAVLAGTTVFHPNLPIDIKGQAFRAEFVQRLSRLRVLRFYLTHPQRLLQKLRVTAEHGYSLRIYAGNFEQAAGLPAYAKTERWSWWGNFKERHWPKSLWFLAAYCALLAGWLLRGYRRAQPATGRLAREFGLALWLMLLAAFITPILGDGESDLPKHLFLFNVFFDLSLLFVTAFGALKLRSLLQPSSK